MCYIACCLGKASQQQKWTHVHILYKDVWPFTHELVKVKNKKMFVEEDDCLKKKTYSDSTSLKTVSLIGA